MYKQNDKNETVIENYQRTSTFASFLPGIVGLKGIPMWTFYINRGQAISSFGIDNKDSAISEFLSADKAYQQTPLQGFRTFIKVKRSDETKMFEPFSDADNKVEETMTIGMNHLELNYKTCEENISLTVRYYSLPYAPIGALVRTVQLTNHNTEAIDIELADGLASVLPAGIANAAYKEIGNTLKSWFDVKEEKPNFNFYHLRGSTADTEDVSEIENGNFYSSLVKENGKTLPAKIIYDRQLIFGNDETLRFPRHFENTKLSEIVLEEQVSTNKVSSGFTLWEGQLASEESVEIMTLVGYGTDKETIAAYLDENFNEQTIKKGFSTSKILIDDLTEVIQTSTANKVFDQYARQSYLDNGLRGGFPTIHKYKDEQHAFYVYSRKHGDLERDYNFFTTAPTYYSQGNGNYRDINQNRRMDVFFTPEIEDENIHHFVDLIQLDGYNPLVTKEVTYQYESTRENLEIFVSKGEQVDLLNEFFKKAFEPGELLFYIQEHSIVLKRSFEEFLAYVLCNSSQNLAAEHGEGFWVDHWIYNLDLIDQYLAIYPDKINQLMFGRAYKFYRNQAIVQPRIEKYVQNSGEYRQYGAIKNVETTGSQWVESVENQLITTNLYSKLLLLAAVKTATIAPFGYGISMEAGKPGWNDSLNGLPGLFGTSTSELFELKRLLSLLQSIDSTESKLNLPVEAAVFVEKLVENIGRMKKDDQKFWNETTNLLETYRATIYTDLTGEMKEFSREARKTILSTLMRRVEKALEAVDKFNVDGLIPTYFYFEYKDEKMIPHVVTPFLEGMVKKMKVTTEKSDAKNIYQAVKKSAIFDNKLQMYKTSAPLTNEPVELGRVRFFTRGWLENESVFLHMAYKYLLELLKNNLYDEFYKDIHTMLIPNLEPEIYGRSILENSSFIASSANPDEGIHGKGFVARLSGSTVEFLSMWVQMFIGEEPFKWNEKEQKLTFQLQPILHKDLFKADGTIQFNLLGDIHVTYYNEQKKDTFGENGVRPVSYHLYYTDKQEKIIENDYLKDTEARNIRNKRIEAIHVMLR